MAPLPIPVDYHKPVKLYADQVCKRIRFLTYGGGGVARPGHRVIAELLCLLKITYALLFVRLAIP